MSIEWSGLLIGVVAVAVLLYGFSKTAMPVAGAFAGPLLAAALGPAVASGFIVPLLVVGDLIALAYYRSHADWKLIRKLIPGVLVGFLIIAVMFKFVPMHYVARFLGVLILVSVFLEIYRLRNARKVAMEQEEGGEPNRWAAAFFGTLTGMTTMGANAGGAAMTLYLVKMRVPMLTFMGTSAWFFFVMNLLKVPVVVSLGLLNWQSLLVNLYYVPVLLVGAIGGAAIFRRMNATFFTYAALVLSAAAALWLITRG